MTKKKSRGESEPYLILNGKDIRQMQKEEVQVTLMKLRSEIEQIKMSVTGLNIVRGKLITSKNVIEELAERESGAKALVQLNESLFVEGKIMDTSTFRIKLGAGYLVDMSKDTCVKYYDWKIDCVTKQADEMAVRLNNGEKVVAIVTDHLQKMDEHENQSTAVNTACS